MREAKYLSILLEYPGVGNEYPNTRIITEVCYSDANKQWHIKYDHATQVEGGERKYFKSEYEDVVDIFCRTLELNVRSYTYCIDLHAEGG